MIGISFVGFIIFFRWLCKAAELLLRTQRHYKRESVTHLTGNLAKTALRLRDSSSAARGLVSTWFSAGAVEKTVAHGW
jgi:hypothetical protein